MFPLVSVPGLEIGDLILAVEGAPVLDGSEEAIDITETKNRVRGVEGTRARAAKRSIP